MALIMSARPYLWKLSPSMYTGAMCSREKMCSKERLTVVVPAPLDPVTATTGWLRRHRTDLSNEAVPGESSRSRQPG